MNLPKIIAAAISLMTLSSNLSAPAADELTIYIGAYTKEPRQGISLARFNTVTGEVGPIQPAAATASPTFLTLHPGGKYLYAVNENGAVAGQKIGGLSAFAIDAETGALAPLNAVAAGGGLCHLTVDATGKYLLAAAYGGGSTEVWSLKESGEIGERVQFIQHPTETGEEGKPNKPHGHQIILSPDNRFALAVDLGLDKVFVHHFDASTGKLTPGSQQFVSLAPGAGPRHLTFSHDARFAYVINEHGSTIAAFEYQDGTLQPLQTVSTLPENFDGKNYTAEIAIHPNGKFLYGSNRGRDSIVVFARNPETGKLERAGEAFTEGPFPRHFSLSPDGNWMLVVNQNDSSLTVFKVDADTGQLTKHSRRTGLPGKPVCVIFP